jgi:hypothetical protein
MSLLINLTPAEEAQLSTAAMQTGLAPEAFAEKLVRDHLPTSVPAVDLDKKLRQWQEQDGTRLIRPGPPPSFSRNGTRTRPD